MKERLVVTGMGAVTPIGIGVPAYWNGIVAGKCGIDTLSRIDLNKVSVKKGAEVKGFDPNDHLPIRLVTDLDLFMQYAYVSAEEALADSGLEIEPERTGIVMGSALSGLTLIGDTQEAMATEGKHVSPRFLSQVMGNIAASQFSISHNIQGPSMTVSTACSSGGDAICLAAMLLEIGAADAMVVMAGESAISKLFINSLYKAGALSKTGESRPFDKNRNGFVIGEGGGALILETESHARKRNADIKAILLGYANNTDAYHVVSPEPEGSGTCKCMELALRKAGIEPAAVGYINAHGTATVLGDQAESKGIRRVFGDSDVFVSSTKGMTGHMMAAGGITEVIACIKAIETGILPPNINLDDPDPECDLNLVRKSTPKQRIDIAMSNAFGFGGQNSCVIIGRAK